MSDRRLQSTILYCFLCITLTRGSALENCHHCKEETKESREKNVNALLPATNFKSSIIVEQTTSDSASYPFTNNGPVNLEYTISPHDELGFWNESRSSRVRRSFESVKQAALKCNEPFKLTQIDPSKRTAILIPDIEPLGLMESDWVTLAKTLHMRGYTVIRIDWTEFQPRYDQAVSNARGVAMQVRRNIIDKVPQEMRQRIHLIGMGIGAHIAGYIGKAYLSTKIGRITALNPARKFFEYEDGPSIIRLTEEDAEFVDVIHTDYKGLMRVGMIHRAGTVDFYADLDSKTYPGCTSPNVPKNITSAQAWRQSHPDLKKMISTCAHGAALKVFVGSIVQCPLWARRASADPCLDNNCIPIGLYTDSFFKLSDNSKRKGNYMFRAKCEHIPRNQVTLHKLLNDAIKVYGAPGEISKDAQEIY